MLSENTGWGSGGLSRGFRGGIPLVLSSLRGSIGLLQDRQYEGKRLNVATPLIPPHPSKQSH